MPDFDDDNDYDGVCVCVCVCARMRACVRAYMRTFLVVMIHRTVSR